MEDQLQAMAVVAVVEHQLEEAVEEEANDLDHTRGEVGEVVEVEVEVARVLRQ